MALQLCQAPANQPRSLSRHTNQDRPGNPRCSVPATESLSALPEPLPLQSVECLNKVAFATEGCWPTLNHNGGKLAGISCGKAHFGTMVCDTFLGVCLGNHFLRARAYIYICIKNNTIYVHMNACLSMLRLHVIKVCVSLKDVERCCGRCAPLSNGMLKDVKA